MALGLLAGVAGAQVPGKPMQPVQIGEPYRIDGKEYRPVDGPLDEVGYAGVMPATGDAMADGPISAAHRTLPIPSYAEVTALATGRTILVLVDQRGPMVSDRVIDLSCGAVRQLGLVGLPAPVRVRRVNPPEQERATLRADRKAAERMASPAGLLSALRRQLSPAPRPINAGDCALPPVDDAPAPPSPKPQLAEVRPKITPKPKPAIAQDPEPQAPSASSRAPKGPGYDIQVAALTNRAKAASLARSVGGRVEVAGTIFRIRTGPYPTEAAARAALPQIRAKGFADARVVTNGGR